MKKILLIGGAGYIGTAIHDYFKKDYDITIVDLLWFGNYTDCKKVWKMDYRNLTLPEIAPFDIVILLAAFSSPAMAVNSGVRATMKENFDNFVGLVNKLLPTQKFIYASTASLYSGLQDYAPEDIRLNDPDNSYDLGKRAADDIMRLYPTIEYYSLRLGTVCGASNQFRVDTAVNSMTVAAMTTGALKVYNGEVRRAFIEIGDLCRAVEKILQADDKRGVYNLATFNSTMDEVAEALSHNIGAQLTRVSQAEVEKALGSSLPKTYDFSIDTSKFEETFNFEFTGTIGQITNNIETEFHNLHMSKRVEGKKYE